MIASSIFLYSLKSQYCKNGFLLVCCVNLCVKIHQFLHNVSRLKQDMATMQRSKPPEQSGKSEQQKQREVLPFLII